MSKTKDHAVHAGPSPLLPLWKLHIATLLASF
jgi:hypothetical protein